MTYKLTAPSAHNVSKIGSESDPMHRTWIVLGVGYTDSESLANWAKERGYTVEKVDDVPDIHTTAIANLESYGFSSKNYGTADGADPEAIYRFTSHDGHTQIDVRDVIAGRHNPTSN